MFLLCPFLKANLTFKKGGGLRLCCAARVFVGSSVVVEHVNNPLSLPPNQSSSSYPPSSQTPPVSLANNSMMFTKTSFPHSSHTSQYPSSVRVFFWGVYFLHLKHSSTDIYPPTKSLECGFRTVRLPPHEKTLDLIILLLLLCQVFI